jgi:hypothetical protein
MSIIESAGPVGFAFGKAPAEDDPSVPHFSTFLKATAPSPPPQFDVDGAHAVPLQRFCNPPLADCVIACRANHTLRFKLIEHDRIIPITDQDVVNEYYLETGNTNKDIVVLKSLRAWRTRGWQAAGSMFRIKAFAKVSRRNFGHLRASIFANVGVELGLLLPAVAWTQATHGQPWTVESGPGSAVDRRNGHCVYVSGYTPIGPVCITWGQKQQMTWDYVAKYSDEAYAVFDSLDSVNGDIIDKEKLLEYIELQGP